ncbi:MAG: 2-C-methyl-D-erythritol 4-phosphate cytidylyltransferase, partial [Clostridia bacterium]|nr:2-C-methyl-D-erythritol 4-phosphate cytidylyltransferase [Clostridia bacterium]
MDVSVSAIIVAAGAANRFGQDKLKLPFAGTTVALAAVRPFVLCPKVGEVVFVAPKGQAEEYRAIFHKALDYDPWGTPTLSNPFDPDGKLWQKRPVLFWQVTEGGDTRTESVKAGLEVARGRFVLVHDGARPNVSINLIDKVIEALTAHPDHGILPVTPVVNSVLTVGDEGAQYLDRSRVRELQTPQGFDAARLKEALAQGDYTDEGSAYARTHPLLTVEGEVENR